MLSEIPHIKAIQDEPRRRWFADEEFDLIVWYEADELVVGFQLCYDKQKNQRAFTWRAPGYSRHDRVDDGENNPGRYKATPILVSDGAFAAADVAERFKAAGSDIDGSISSLVIQKILDWHPPKPEIRRPRL